MSFWAGRRRGPGGLGTVGEVREAIVDRIMVAAAIGMGLVFLTGVMVGIILMVAMAIRGEDKRGTLTQGRTDR